MPPFDFLLTHLCALPSDWTMRRSLTLPRFSDKWQPLALTQFIARTSLAKAFSFGHLGMLHFLLSIGQGGPLRGIFYIIIKPANLFSTHCVPFQGCQIRNWQKWNRKWNNWQICCLLVVFFSYWDFEDIFFCKGLQCHIVLQSMLAEAHNFLACAFFFFLMRCNIYFHCFLMAHGHTL